MNALTEHAVKIQQLKRKFESEGHEVLVAPSDSVLPFDLANYSPDLVVKKSEGGGFIVEVKTPHAKISLERYQSIAHIVRQHDGWRFLLVTVDDLNVPTFAEEIAGWDKLEAKLKNTRPLIDGNHVEAAVLYLWAIFEAAMRKLAIAEAMPIEHLPAVKVLNQLYTIGYVSVDQFSTVKKFLSMRNNIAHGFTPPADEPLVESFFQIVADLMAEWKTCSAESALSVG